MGHDFRILTLAVAAGIGLARPGHDLCAQEGPGSSRPSTAIPDSVSSPGALVSWEEIEGSADTRSAGWYTYSGSLDGQRHSRLERIDRGNVHRLSVAWVHQLETTHRVETSPLVADGVMYVTAPPRDGAGRQEVVKALDVRTGRPLWTHERELPDDVVLCCGPVNRGAAVLGDAVYVGTVDAHLLALDAYTGQLLWETEVAESRDGYSITSAPLVVEDKVLTGIAGGEFGIRGFVAAYDAETGDQVWRFETIPEPGDSAIDTWEGDSWKTGAGPTWGTGSYDPQLGLVYWGVGHAGPGFDGRDREGRNLYTNSVVALDVGTGELRWHFQFTPHGTHDWDATQIPVLVDAEYEGSERKLLAWANRNGFYYLLDRASGEFLRARAFAQQTWAAGIDSTGSPSVRDGSDPSYEGSLVAPAGEGATNWWSPAYSPETGLFYVNAYDGASRFFLADATYSPGTGFHGGFPMQVSEEQAGFEFENAIRALDLRTGELVWEYALDPPTEGPRGGLLSTAGGLLFGSSPRGYFFALDARTGEELWHLNLGARIVANPVTFTVDGEQYVSVAAGNAIFTFELGGE